jgi:effector-binding domain-containing protein
MIDEPRIVQTDGLFTAVIHLTVPRHQMPHVMGPAVQEVLAVVAQQGVTPSGPVFAHHFAMSPDVFDFEVGVPIPVPLVDAGRVRGGRLASVAAVTAVHRGGYDALPAAWGELESWMRAKGYVPASDLWESYAVGPESGTDQTRWRTELVRPVAALGGT